MHQQSRPLLDLIPSQSPPAQHPLPPISAKLRSSASPCFNLLIDQPRPVPIDRLSKLPTHSSERRRCLNRGDWAEALSTNGHAMTTFPTSRQYQTRSGGGAELRGERSAVNLVWGLRIG
ncbi:hypothetical protein RB13250 [Rhodopirellula baltica SH 1]|uniref:Uncharacterized protein n=1 Tax=Rhodopirellula baltica (strain DSM 10527 / NCIMB 13988 / SH1) TaxID=243090 RepID=Q7UHE8_RHOBA|nr:hypothetical protein RB13250 [Rhodopirellula baltica SH 1]